MLTPSNARQFYEQVYRGDGDSRNLPVARSAAILDGLTSGRASRVAETDTELTKLVNLAQCAIIDALIEFADTPVRVLSESTDGVSVTYAAADNAAVMRRFKDAAAAYLGITGLMYRGCRG